MPSGPSANKIKRLRERDGDLCWLCSKAIDFEAKPNSEGAWSIEHLLAKKHGGVGKIENLALCHPPCNRKLRDLSLAEKVTLREEARRAQWMEQLVAKAVQALAA